MPKYINIKSGLPQTMTEAEFNKLPNLLKSKYSLVKKTKETEPTTKQVEKKEIKA
jgi:hypothetical protein